ncbi:MAG: restriction endonuclease subunit S, partial [bacterium]
HWSVQRLKTIATINDEALPEDTDPRKEFFYVEISSVDPNKGIIAKEELTFQKAPSRARRIVRDGDVIVSTVRTYLRAISEIREPEANLIVSTGFAVVRPGSQLEKRFGAYALRAPYFVDRVVSESVGVSFPAINSSGIGCLPIALPSKPEQRAIIAFLDRKTAKIDALVAKKERLIELLEERRASLIIRTVTEGLSPDKPSKDSGVAWLGQMPGDWELRSLGRLLTSIEQGWSPTAEGREADSSEWAVTKLNAVSHGNFNDREHKALPADLVPIPALEIKPGDVLLTRSNTPKFVGDACFVTNTRQHLMFSDLIYRLTVATSAIDARFLVYWLLSQIGRSQIVADARGSSLSMVKISKGHIRSWLVLVPPVDEQLAIVEFLDCELDRIGGLTRKIGKAIAYLNELRASLISSTVTGKIDVRGEAS